MREVQVFAGLPGPRKLERHDLVLPPAAPQGESDGAPVRLHELTRKMLRELPPRLLDLLEIASYVYSADQLTLRDSPKMPRMGADWRRSFDLHVAVRDPQFWGRQDIVDHLTSTLGFLSDDRYSFAFDKHKPRAASQPYLEFDAMGPAAGFVPDEVMLFSGGLDSFAGAAEGVLRKHKRLALVSHRSSPMVASFQAGLVQKLRERGRADQILHLSVGVARGAGRAVDFTQRTRSFLFAVLGFLVAHLLGRRSLSFYENGIVSLNLPLATHVVGSRATRTTHPRVLDGFGALFSQVVADDIRVENPYAWQTKAEVVRCIADLGCGDLIPGTFSCAGVRQATMVTDRRHCGLCSQCLDRRFGVLAADCGRFEPEAIYEVDLFRGERKPGVSTNMAASYVLSALRHASSTEAAFLGAYAEVLRVVPHLRGLSAAEALSRLHRLHRRHGQAVMAVVDEQISKLDTAARLVLPDSSLLAMLTAPQACDITCVDPAEKEPTAEAQAHARPFAIVPRPITLAVSEPEVSVVVAGRITFIGKQAQLIRALLPPFRAGQAADAGPSGFTYVRAKQLAADLATSEAGLRQLVARLRSELASRFNDEFDVAVGSDDVIQNSPWAGYRLSPYLAFTHLTTLHEPVSGAAD